MVGWLAMVLTYLKLPLSLQARKVSVSGFRVREGGPLQSTEGAGGATPLPTLQLLVAELARPHRRGAPWFLLRDLT